MLVNRNYVARLRPTLDQVRLLDEQGHAARATWNMLHDWWQMNSQHRRVSLRDADEAIRQARHDIDWLAVLPAQAAQQVLKAYHRAWVNCWEGRAGPPRFKSRPRARMVVDVPQASKLKVARLTRRWGRVNVPKVGPVRFRWTRDIPGRVTGARLIRDPLGWHIAFRTEITVSDPKPHPGSAVGIDRGVNVALALSNGKHETHGPWLRPGERKRLLRLERKAARQYRARERNASASNRRRGTYGQIAELRARAKRRRSDWQHQVTTDLARQYGLVVVEDLRISNMTRSTRGTVETPGRGVRQKSGLNRVILDEAHAGTVYLLAYKLTDRGGTLVKVPAPYTSQRCSGCGAFGARAGIRFVCPACGLVEHADTNAAKNILADGWSVNGRGDDPVAGRCEASTTRGAVSATGIPRIHPWGGHQHVYVRAQRVFDTDDAVEALRKVVETRGAYLVTDSLGPRESAWPSPRHTTRGVLDKSSCKVLLGEIGPRTVGATTRNHYWGRVSEVKIQVGCTPGSVGARSPSPNATSTSRSRGRSARTAPRGIPATR